MKRILKMLIIVVIISGFSISVSAGEVDEHLEEFEMILPDGFAGITEDADAITHGVGIEALLSEVLGAISGRRGEIVSFFLFLIGAVALTSLSSFYTGKLSGAVSSGMSILISVLIALRMGALFDELGTALAEMNKFFGTLIPVLTAINVSGGGGASAGVQAAGMNIALTVVGGAGSALFSAVCGFGFALGMLAPFDPDGAGGVARSVKGFFMWLVGIATALLMGTFSLQSIIASATDSAAMRAAKYAASGMIPVVGGAVSGALSTLASGLSYVKGVVGISSVAVILSVMLSPLAVLLLYRLALSLALSFAEFVGCTGGAACFSGFRSSLDSLIATYSLSGVVYIFEIILFIKSGVPLQ